MEEKIYVKIAYIENLSGKWETTTCNSAKHLEALISKLRKKKTPYRYCYNSAITYEGVYKKER